jgi:hypothetical protein
MNYTYLDGVKEGMEIARKMLCDALNIEEESLGKAVAQARLMRIKLDQYEKTTRD